MTKETPMVNGNSIGEDSAGDGIHVRYVKYRSATRSLRPIDVMVKALQQNTYHLKCPEGLESSFRTMTQGYFPTVFRATGATAVSGLLFVANETEPVRASDFAPPLGGLHAA